MRLPLLAILLTVGTSSLADEDTACGNCVFPFTINRRLHKTCTTIDGNSIPWCPTKTGNREYCTSSTCPSINPPAMYIHPNNAVGKCSCGVPNRNKKHRVVGGVEADIGEYPWQVALLFGACLDSQFCGGSLVSDRYVITAAHCTAGRSNIKVRVGDTNLALDNEATAFTINVKTIKQHPDYRFPINDISVLELETPVDLTAYPNIKPICLPAQGATYANTEASVSGWGTLRYGWNRATHLNEVAANVFSDDDCGMSADILCALDKDGGTACHDDSGGPLSTQDSANNNAETLIGVVSSGGCAVDNRIVRYAEVSHFRSWLDSQLTDINTCSPPASKTWKLQPVASFLSSRYGNNF